MSEQPDLGNHDLDLPFLAQQPSPMNPAENPLIAGALVVMATVVDVPEVGKKPGLLFRFVDPVGNFHRSVLLVQDDDQMAKLRPLILAAVAEARRGAQL